MVADLRVFLDTSVLFSETGGARLILKLGEAGAISLWVGPWVLKEAEAVLECKAPKSKGYFALLLDRAQVSIGQKPEPDTLEKALQVTDYLPDAQILAEALAIGADYFCSFDRQHLVGNPRTKALPFPVGTAGDFLTWYRERLTRGV